MSVRKPTAITLLSIIVLAAVTLLAAMPSTAFGLTATLSPTPSVTRTPSPTVPACVNAPEPKLSIGARGAVPPARPGNVPNVARLRDKPAISAKIVAYLPQLTRFTVTDNAVCADTYLWWPIKTTQGITGWLAEGDSQRGAYIVPEDFLLTPTPVTDSPYPTQFSIFVPFECPGAPTRLVTGGQGVVLPGQEIRVHEYAGTDAPIFRTTSIPGGNDAFTGILKKDATFYIPGSPECIDKRVWWTIEFSYRQQNQLFGAIAEGEGNTYFVAPVGVVITATPSPTELPGTPTPGSA